MSSNVTVQVGDVGKIFATFRTRVFLDAFVNLDVFPEVRVLEKAFGAEVAAKGPLGFVNSLDVIVELALPEKYEAIQRGPQSFVKGVVGFKSEIEGFFSDYIMPVSHQAAQLHNFFLPRHIK